MAATTKWRYDRGTEEFSRFLAFTDAVIAIAMTLLVLGIDIPRPASGSGGAGVDVWAVFGDLWPQIFAFVLSFVIIGFYWVQHHRFVSALEAVDMVMLKWNLCFLLVIVSLPLMSELIGYYGNNEQAVTVYAASFVALGVVDSISYLIAVRRGLMITTPSAAMVRFQMLARLTAPFVFAISIPIAFVWSPAAAEYSWIAIWPLSLLTTRNPPEV